KSMREAKVHSTWAAPNSIYEDAVLSFVEDALDAERSRAFFNAFLPFEERIARLGVENSLVQTLLKLTVPGVPDIYQGAELWDLSLVDPDNRRPVDYSERIQLLDQFDHEPGAINMHELLDHWQDGAIKLFVTAKILRYRQEHPEVFQRGEYEQL